MIGLLIPIIAAFGAAEVVKFASLKSQFPASGNGRRWLGKPVWVPTPEPVEIADASPEVQESFEFRLKVASFQRLGDAVDKRVRKGCRCSICCKNKSRVIA